MGHGKETPRQKMIGMMYLVLTALLALNVSKDILEAFVLIDEGVATTTENFAEKNGMIYDEFDKSLISNPVKVKPWKAKADEVRKRSNVLFDKMHQLKIDIIKKSDGDDAPAVSSDNKITGKLVAAKDNSDAPAQVMIGDNNDKEGKKLKNDLKEYREYLISLVDKKDKGTIESLEKTLNTNDPPPTPDGATHSWESEHFEHLPLIAVTTILSNLQSSVRNAESEIVRYLYNQIDAGSFKFNKLEPTIITNSNYIIQGNEYNAEVFIAAQDTTRKPEVFVGNYETIKLPDGSVDYKMVGSYVTLDIDPKTGRGIYKKTGGAISPKIKWGGLIQIKATDGTILKRPFSAEYQVAEPMTAISPTKMNVFYIGVPNPVTISASGMAADKLTAEITNGVIQREGNAWVVNPSKKGEAIISVYGEVDKKKKKLGEMLFRVKEMPDPTPMVGGLKSGSIDKSSLDAQSFVIADMGDFLFDAKFTVMEFTMTGTVKGFANEFKSNSNKFTPEMKSLIKNMGKGDRVFFDGIKAKGPDNKLRELNGIVLKVK